MDTETLAPLDALNIALGLVHNRVSKDDWSSLPENTRAPFESLSSAVLPTKAHGTVKAWMVAHNGQSVYTLQIGRNGRNPWAPDARVINASRPSRVSFDDSIREYSGCSVVAASDNVLIMSTAHQVAMYVIA